MECGEIEEENNLQSQSKIEYEKENNVIKIIKINKIEGNNECFFKKLRIRNMFV